MELRRRAGVRRLRDQREQGDPDQVLGVDVSPPATQLYAHVTPKMRANAAARFGSLLSRARLAPVAEAEGSQAETK